MVNAVMMMLSSSKFIRAFFLNEYMVSTSMFVLIVPPIPYVSIFVSLPGRHCFMIEHEINGDFIFHNFSSVLLNLAVFFRVYFSSTTNFA